MVTQFVPVPPGWAVRFGLANSFMVYPLLGWLLTSDGPQPAVWQSGVTAVDTVADLLEAETVTVEPAE